MNFAGLILFALLSKWTVAWRYFHHINIPRRNMFSAVGSSIPQHFRAARTSRLDKAFHPDEASNTTIDSLVVSGFLGPTANLEEVAALNNIYNSKRFKNITVIATDLARVKRLITTPAMVYSGFSSSVTFHQGRELRNLGDIVKGADAWLASNVSIDEVDEYAKLAVLAGARRVVFLVHIPAKHCTVPALTFNSATSLMGASGINYSIIKYGSREHDSVGRRSFRVLHGADDLCVLRAGNVFTEDLYKVASEILDIPKTYNSVYGIVHGTELDAEIAAYMTSSGWPERVKIGVLVGDIMNRIEESWQGMVASKS